MRVYRFHDGRFSFWEAIFGRSVLVFRVREDNTPANRAFEKGIPSGTPLREAPPAHIQAWLEGHPGYPVIEESTDSS